MIVIIYLNQNVFAFLSIFYVIGRGFACFMKVIEDISISDDVYFES